LRIIRQASWAKKPAVSQSVLRSKKGNLFITKRGEGFAASSSHYVTWTSLFVNRLLASGGGLNLEIAFRGKRGKHIELKRLLFYRA
jgi:hypothetical protein